MKVNKIQFGSKKTFRGYEINIELCIKQDTNNLSFDSWFQLEIIKGDKIAFARTLPNSQLLTDVEDYVYKKIDELIEAEKKQ